MLVPLCITWVTYLACEGLLVCGPVTLPAHGSSELLEDGVPLPPPLVSPPPEEDLISISSHDDSDSDEEILAGYEAYL